MALAKNISFFANGYSLADALKSFSIEADSDEVDATVLANDFRSYEQGFKSGTLNASGIFDHDEDLLNKIHDVFSAALTAGNVLNVLASFGDITLGAAALILKAVETKYSVDIPLGQLIMSNAVFRAEDNIDFGRFLISEQIDEGSIDGDSIDNGAASSNGGILQVQLQNDDATDVDVLIQHSVDDSTWVDLISVEDLSDAHDSGFAVVAPGTTVNRHLRAVVTVTGGNTFLVSAAFARR